MRTQFLLLLLLVVTSSRTQSPEFRESSLPENLTKNANAIVMLDDWQIEIVSRNSMEVQHKSVVTVLNKDGNRAVHNYAYYDKVTKLKDLYVEIFDKNGELIKRIKQKEFKDITAIDGFTIYTDSRIKYFNFTPIDYPYTISFSYTYETSNTAFIPYWSPLGAYEVSLKKSSFKLNCPAEFEMRIKEKNFEGQEISNLSKGQSLHYEMNNVPAVRKEMLSPEFFKIGPRLLVAIDNFHLEGVNGQAKDWHSLGKWQYENLIQSQDYLDPQTIRELGQRVSGIEDPVEKVRQIYQYVQENTRYVSVQLGIGGWKPISAQEVDRVKYGDCKGLTNYTKALLKSQGIESYYSVVWAGDSKRDMEPDFASIQGNHVILNVPMEEKDIWLECTSQEIPFGFLGDFTDDRDVLVVMPEGGVLKHTDSYLNEYNRRSTKSAYRISDSGKLEADLEVECKGIAYDQRSVISGLSENKKYEFYKEYWDHINGLEINSMQHMNDKERVVLNESLELEASSYATKIGNDLLFKINPFDLAHDMPLRYRSRKLPFEIQRGYLHEADYTIKLPESYVLTDLPEPINISNEFGSYEVELRINEEGALRYKRKLLIKKGSYAKEQYKNYRDFRREIAKYDNLKLLLNQKT